MSNRILKRKPRKFLGEEFVLDAWENLKPFYDNLIFRTVDTPENFEIWLKDRSELESYLSENMAWRYIKMTCDTANEENQKAYQFFVQEIQPNTAVYMDNLNKKTLQLAEKFPLTASGYDIMLRSIKKYVEIFREENIALDTQIQIKQTEYQSVTGSMTIEMDGEEITMPKAATYLQGINREKREEAWTKISDRRLQDKDKLDEIFNALRDLRHQEALNADFANFRDYMFAAMGRFDYTPADCFAFHDAVAETVVPLVDIMVSERKKSLGYEQLRPWDLKVDVAQRPGLKPFKDANDLLDKTEICFEKISPELAEYVKTMRAMGHFDLESRKGKAPGGYNYPLEEIGVPFIFMNATDSLRDLVTMVHEGGHAIHSFEVRNLPINAFRNPTMEVAELASMSMELISMEHWDVYFSDENELKRAKIEHLEDVLSTLPWIATVDKFQHWIYENPTHTIEERKAAWVKISGEFSDNVVDYDGLEKYKGYSWQRQLHIFEVPFYYIEYGMAQLGAISVWRNYKKDPETGLKNYLAALKLGYTKTIGEIYETAGIKFDFSKAYIAELMDFVKGELDLLRK
ncbi:M3 family oligoendopeptidase [Lacihabitans lacunae]|jgi:oligoendopeptidase F|uniref:M3 family oligoendopeptidase n=1 Tax=Lacihabitans lacunae TaxID=1028214 RepID=A0ABV7YYP4_9BACT